jgi:hypothetical protein
MEHPLSFKSTASSSRSIYLLRIAALAALLLLAEWVMPYLTFFGEYERFSNWWISLVIFGAVSFFLLRERMYTEVLFDDQQQQLTVRSFTPWKADDMVTISYATLRFSWRSESRAMGRSVMVLQITGNGKNVFKVAEGFSGYSIEALEAIKSQLVMLRVPQD